MMSKIFHIYVCGFYCKKGIFYSKLFIIKIIFVSYLLFVLKKAYETLVHII